MLVAFDLSLRLPLYYSRRQPLGERRHRGLARRVVAVSRLAVLVTHPRRTERARRPTFMIRPTTMPCTVCSASDRDCRVCSRFDISRRRRSAPREISPHSLACTKGGILGSRPRTSHRR